MFTFNLNKQGQADENFERTKLTTIPAINCIATKQKSSIFKLFSYLVSIKIKKFYYFYTLM